MKIAPTQAKVFFYWSMRNTWVFQLQVGFTDQ